MNNFTKHYNKAYDLFNIPKTSNYDELIFIINYGLKEGIYQNLPGRYCGDKANNLLIKWGYKKEEEI
jgi:hypothetical protein